MILPLVALGGYATLAFGAAIGVVRIVKILENSADYSIQNTTRQALFLPTSREVKYKAKAAIDTFFVRTGDVMSAVVVAMGTALALKIEQFAAANLVLAGIWIALAVSVLRHYRRIAGDARGS
jgi:AAA family ATP:ADP antiporter